jgi:hypothetical protein
MDKDTALDLALEALEQGIDGQTSIQMDKAITAIKQARSAPAQEPVAFNAGVPPLYPKMKDGETISVEYTTPPGGRQSEDCLTAAQEDIQRLSALVRAQQITIDKLEQARSAPVQEPDHSDELTIAYMSGVQRGKELAAQRQWVGLTDDEFENIELGCRSTPFGKIEAMRKVEAKLKEKNGGVV